MSKEIIDRLRDDEDYYGEFGNQFLSNSHISKLLKNPMSLYDKTPNNPNFLVGGYFHTAILEPDKLKSFKIIESSTRNTKKYKEISGGELCLLQHEVDKIEVLIDKVMSNEVCQGLIRPSKYEYELPGIADIDGLMWKGKADIVNHDDKLIVDLKTTSKLDDFKWSARKYNYDSQAYIYQRIFGYDMIFIAVDKNTHQIGIYDCSTDFLERGYDKVMKATEAYNLFYNDPDFKPENFFINETL